MAIHTTAILAAWNPGSKAVTVEFDALRVSAVAGLNVILSGVYHF